VTKRLNHETDELLKTGSCSHPNEPMEKHISLLQKTKQNKNKHGKNPKTISNSNKFPIMGWGSVDQVLMESLDLCT
jgi:hypothetical protein